MSAEVHVALLTPADGEGLLDERALAGHVDWLADSGADGVLVAGTTGEGPLLDDEDVTRAVAVAAEAAAGRLQVVAHVGRPSTRATVRLAREAAAAGATSVAAVVPYYFAFDEDQLLGHFAELAAAVPLPVVAYTIPVRTHHEVSGALLERMIGSGLAGIKDSTKSEERHAEYLEVARRHEGTRVYMGSDGLALMALREGATGLMSAVANAIPERVVALRDAVAAEDWTAAETLQDEILAFRTRIKQGPDFVALKQEVAERLSADRRYPTDVRRPLGVTA
jgi:4-hydroxy-tetrahydrodipicolinate synthase/2-dehydro-3-deoxy-phosphogluconate/2-dehydro-3-deoxy-6-phosphogalactonate aldolase